MPIRSGREGILKRKNLKIAEIMRVTDLNFNRLCGINYSVRGESHEKANPSRGGDAKHDVSSRRLGCRIDRDRSIR